MGSGYRIARSVILALYGIIAIALSLSVIEFGMYFGVILMISAALTAIYLFIHFSGKIDQKVIIEGIADGFAGLVVFTFPEPNVRFFMIDFSFWIAIMGALYFVRGIYNSKKSNYMWLYLLSGIIMIVIGFIIMNYSTDYIGSVSYLIGLILTYYAILNAFSLNKSTN